MFEPLAVPAFPSPPFANGQTFIDPVTGRTFQFDASLPGWRIALDTQVDIALPRVERVNLRDWGIVLHLSHAVSSNTNVAFWRWRKGLSGKIIIPGQGSAPNLHEVDGFRPIQSENTQGNASNPPWAGPGFPLLTIPAGAHEFALPGGYQAYFNPPPVRGGSSYSARNYSRFHRDVSFPQELYGKNRATKCILKFGVSRKQPGRHREFGAASVETITIMRWRYANPAPPPDDHSWGLKIIVT